MWEETIIIWRSKLSELFCFHPYGFITYFMRRDHQVDYSSENFNKSRVQSLKYLCILRKIQIQQVTGVGSVTENLENVRLFNQDLFDNAPLERQQAMAEMPESLFLVEDPGGVHGSRPHCSSTACWVFGDQISGQEISPSVFVSVSPLTLLAPHFPCFANKKMNCQMLANMSLMTKY